MDEYSWGVVDECNRQNSNVIDLYVKQYPQLNLQ